MVDLPYKAVKEKIESARSVTIISHVHPDADTLGTALGIYALLKKEQKRVEVVNYSTDLPRYLDFLPHFEKIKQRIDYADSLVITCDSGSLDRLGFSVEKRELINIDHHPSNTMYGSINVVIDACASASQAAYMLFKEIYTINADAATCFYAALLSDTRYFTTSSVKQSVFDVASELAEAGADPRQIAYHFTQKRSLSSLRILQRALESLRFYEDARIATIFVTKEDIEASGATMPDMDGLVDYAKSLVTVQIAVFAIETDKGIRISLRSKGADVSLVAAAFDGGGHKVAAGFTLKESRLQESIDTILEKIRTLGLLDEPIEI